MTLPSKTDKLISIANDYQNFQRFFPDQIKSINIIKSSENETITEEILSFSTVLQSNIQQRTIHKRFSNNKIESKVISGPFKNSTLMAVFDNIDGGTRVSVDVDMHVELKYRILSPIIKKRYKTALTALFYKMNTLALE